LPSLPNATDGLSGWQWKSKVLSLQENNIRSALLFLTTSGTARVNRPNVCFRQAG
jgi:hypothetical protein